MRLPSTALRASVALAGLLPIVACATSPASPSRAASAFAAPAPGAPGLGDPLYPMLGNGGYEVARYELDLAWDPETGELTGTATLDANAERALTTFNLDLHGLAVEGVAVDGVPAAFQRESDELVVAPVAPLAAGAGFEVVVRYGGVPEAIEDPAVPVSTGLGWIRHEDEVYVVSEPSGASSFYPVNDHPLDKATYAVRVTVPEPWVVASNGTLEGVDQLDGSRRYRWSSRDPLASYLVTICIADFELVEGEGPGGLPLRHYLPRGSAAEHANVIEETGRMLAHFEELFGPYPFESYGGIVASLPMGAALETQTIPVYGGRAFQTPVVAHELAHQWFGNSVGFSRWSEIWLAEGFASYAEWLWTLESKGREAFDAERATSYSFLRKREVGPPADVVAEDLFGGEVYVRGPWVLAALHESVGDDTFFGILRAWVERHAYGHGTTDEFVALAVDLGGADVEPLLRSWLFDPVVPDRPDMLEIAARIEEEMAAARAARKAAREAERAAAAEAAEAAAGAGDDGR